MRTLAPRTRPHEVPGSLADVEGRHKSSHDLSIGWHAISDRVVPWALGTIVRSWGTEFRLLRGVSHGGHRLVHSRDSRIGHPLPNHHLNLRGRRCAADPVSGALLIHGKQSGRRVARARELGIGFAKLYNGRAHTGLGISETGICYIHLRSV